MHGLAFKFVYVGKKVRVAFEGVVVNRLGGGNHKRCI